jgi:secreted trypsin-like serine protease
MYFFLFNFHLLFRSGNGISFNEHVSPICLPPPNYIYSSRLNLTITGWGKMGYEGYEGNDHRAEEESPIGSRVVRLQEGIVPIISKKQCGDIKVYGPNRLSRGMFCAGELLGGGADACQGDSGGPAVAEVAGQKTLLGVTR